MKSGKQFTVIAACLLVAGLITSAVAAAPAWRWRVDAWDAASIDAVTLQASTGGEIAWVRWTGIAGPTNTAAATLTLECVTDGWQSTLATFSVSNAVASNAVSGASSMITVSNAQWRVGDRLIPSATGITGGKVSIGYWYYE